MDQLNQMISSNFYKSIKGFDSVELFREILTAIPNAAAVLNEKRQVIYANFALIHRFGFTSIEELLGRAPGEILSCIHALENGKCGVSESCKYCGAYQAIRHTLDTKMSATREFRVSTQINNQLASYDLSVSTIPLSLKDEIYMMLYLIDISQMKRRQMLERIFFHDVVNKISSLSGLMDLMTLEENGHEIKNYVNIARNVVMAMNNDIMAQRQLTQAENGDLEVRVTSIQIIPFIKHLIDLAREMDVAKKINFAVSDKIQDFSVISDPSLLDRIVTNLLKNAAEASQPNQTVTVSAYMENNSVFISVHNPLFIPKEIQLQIFQRSFSTKGEDRGLGTYSIRLLTERYLKGKVRFTSDEQQGTIFYINLPAEILI